LGFSREPYDAVVSWDSLGQDVVRERENDTLRLWYHMPLDTTWRVFIRKDTSTDTVLVKSGLRASFLKNAVLAAEKLPARLQAGKHHPAKPWAIRYNHPLDSFDVSKLLVLEDTAKVAVRPSLSIDSIDRRTLDIAYPWKEGMTYEAVLLPGGVFDMYGLTTADTLRRTMTTGAPKDYGTLSLHLKNLNPDTSYFVKILNATNAIVASYWVQDVQVFDTKLEALGPGIYDVEVVEDLDGNGRWTTGSYDLHRQPERIFRSAIDELRANWELDSEVEVIFK